MLGLAFFNGICPDLPDPIDLPQAFHGDFHAYLTDLLDFFVNTFHDIEQEDLENARYNDPRTNEHMRYDLISHQQHKTDKKRRKNPKGREST
jgi:hypothetical protein